MKGLIQAMCGLVAMSGQGSLATQVDRGELVTNTRSQVLRGPDGAGSW
jgi:hypothetical protein